MLTLLIQNIVHTPLVSLSTICSCSQLGVDLWRYSPVHQHKVSFVDMESLSHTYVYVCSTRAKSQLWSAGHSLGLNSLMQRSPRLLGIIKKLPSSCAQSWVWHVCTFYLLTGSMEFVRVTGTQSRGAESKGQT